MDFGPIPKEVLSISIQFRYEVRDDLKDHSLESVLRNVGENIENAEWTVSTDCSKLTEFTAWTKNWVLWYDSNSDYIRCFAREPVR